MSGPRLTVAEPLLPEKEPINFDVHIRGAPEEVVQLVQNIKEVGEQFLYHWKTFQIVLPPPIITTGSPLPPSTGEVPFITGSNDGSCTLSRRSQKQLKVRNLFVIPSFDELDSVAVDSKGEPRRLTGKQLESLRERGEFEVASINFAGQKHRWQLSEWLQKGTERSRETLLADLAFALRFTLVTARARLFSHFFSVSQSLKTLLVGFLKLLDIIVGVPSLQALNLDTKLREERCRYLVAELVCRPENEQSLELLCSFVRKQMRRAATEKFEVSREAAFTPVRVPYLFLTPKGVELDLRLFSHDLMKRALPTLVQILERETRGWFLHFREKLITELRSQKLPDEEIEKEVNQAVMKEYLQRVYSNILSNSELKTLGEGIPELLVQQAQSVVLMHRAVENVRNKLAKTKDTLRQKLEYNHPILSRISPWLRNRLSAVEAKFIEECQWSAHEEALSLCTNQHLHQTLYFLHRDLIFMREREPVLKKELRKVKSPTRTFQWLTQIWLPTNWIVRRHFQGQSETIPTKLSSTATSITTPRSDPSQAVFLVEKEIVRTTTTRWPFWRWINYCHRTWSWTWNAMFFFGVVVPWCSPVSIRALFCTEPFYPDLELSQLNGTLFPRKSSLTPTLLSRLLTLWRHISKSRTQFETKPDTGFIGKGMTRHVDRVWNYLVKGLLGTICIVFMFPIVCVIASFTSLLIALTAVLWMPLVTLCMHILMALIYDADSPDETRNRYCIVAEALTLDILIKGCLQPVLALFVAVVVCPLLSVAVLTMGLVRYWLRLSWDAIMFRVVIKKRGRVPACDSFVVHRIAGPGLTNDYYYQIKPEQALAAFEAKLELDELEAYKHQMEQIILQPQKDYSQFVKACFGPFSAQLAKVGAYRGLEKESQDLTQILHEKIEKRERILQTGLSPQVKAKVKQNTIDLKITIQQASLILERFYPDHVLCRLPISEEEFWDSKGLSPNDWPGLATLMYADVFSLDFLTPLDDLDTVFKLEPEHGVDISRFSEMVRNAEVGAGCLDLLGPVYAPRGNIQIHSPYLEVSAFNPRSKFLYSTTKKLEKKRDTFTSSTMWLRHKRATPKRQTEDDYSLLWRPWKRINAAYRAEKMQIPLPVPHPAHIAIIIHNRDNDQAIPLDSTTCKYILKVLEDCSEKNLDVSRYRGGGRDNSLDNINSLSSISESSSSESRDCVDAVDVVENFSLKHSVVTTPIVASEELPPAFNWRHSEWTTSSARHREATVRVDLASPEDITLDSDSSRVMFSIYGTTV